MKCSRCIDRTKPVLWELIKGTKVSYEWLCSDCGKYIEMIFTEKGWKFYEIYKRKD